MDVRLFLRLAVCSTLVLGAAACSTDAQPQRPTRGDGDNSNDESSDDDDDESDDDDDSRSTRRDAGRDAGKDAGGSRRDAGRDAGGEDEPQDALDAGSSRDAAGPVANPARDSGGAPVVPPRNTDDPPSVPVTPTPGTGEPAPDDSGGASACAQTIETGLGIFATSCNGCHAAGRYPIDPNNIPADLRPELADRVMRPARSMGAMPQGGPLPVDQQQAIADWMNCL